MTLKQIIRTLYDATGIVDNGHCAICGWPRYWTIAGSNAPADPCQNPKCISHEIDRVLSEESSP